MSAKLEEKLERKPFFTRLPARTLSKLRQLADMDDVQHTDPFVGVLFRLPADTHQRLKELSHKKSLQDREMTMSSTLIELIDNATPIELQDPKTMSEVVCQLINQSY